MKIRENIHKYLWKIEEWLGDGHGVAEAVVLVPIGGELNQIGPKIKTKTKSSVPIEML